MEGKHSEGMPKAPKKIAEHRALVNSGFDLVEELEGMHGADARFEQTDQGELLVIQDGRRQDNDQKKK